jgi:2-isopropylmalate synthase
VTDPRDTTTTPEDSLRLARWTSTSGSNVRSRGAVVIASGDHEWRASADGNGAIDALYRAVDKALAGVLAGHPRLLTYDIHALGEGTDTIGMVTVRIAPPDIGGERGSGEYSGEARGPNIIAASIEAYIAALNVLLGEAHWSGATEAAGNLRGVAVSAGAAREQRADLDEGEAPHDTTAWFER